MQNAAMLASGCHGYQNRFQAYQTGCVKSQQLAGNEKCQYFDVRDESTWVLSVNSFQGVNEMPMKKQKHLYEICIENILQNVVFWLHIKQAYEKNGLLGGPFDNLPASVEQDILDAYESVHVLPGRSNFWLEGQDRWRLFISRRITKLTITEYTDKISLVHIAATCRNLKHLEIRNVQEALPYLKWVSPCLTTLLTLNFESMAHVNRSALKYIKTHCPNLRVLGLKSCFLHDKALCHLKHMPALSELDLRDTEVTHVGLCHVLRQNPQLCILRHPEVVQALHKIYAPKSWLSRGDSARYRLREVDLALSRKDHAGLLGALAAVCPGVERIRVELDVGATPFALAPLASLERLTELDIQCVTHGGKRPWDDPRPAPGQASLFAGSISPILEARGGGLLAVSLEGVAGVHVGLLESRCTRLLSLGLFYNTYPAGSFPDDTKPFPSLRRLLFGSDSDRDEFPAWYLERLLSNRNLEELSLSGSPLLTQDLFARAFRSSGAFPRLRRLELDYCDVAAEVVTAFLQQCGRQSLRELSICGPFVREQAAQALCCIVCEKLDVQLEAYYYAFIKMKKRMVRCKQDVDVFGAGQPRDGNSGRPVELENISSLC